MGDEAGSHADGAPRWPRHGVRPAAPSIAAAVLVAQVALIALIASGGCASLVRPNHETELAELREGRYALDPAHAYLLFKVGHLGLSKVAGRFDDVDATLDFDPDDIESLRLEGVVAVASVDTGDESLDRRLAGADWLDAASHPEALFRTTRVEVVEGVGGDVGDEGSFTVVGDFTLRGVTREIRLEARFGGGADNLLTGRYTLGFEASGEISRSAWGIDSFGALVGDTVELEIHAEFQRRTDARTTSP